MKSEIYKIKGFNNPEKIKMNFSAESAPQFRFMKVDIKFYEILINKLNNILILFDKYNKNFDRLPVSFLFSKLLGKSHRFKKIYKLKGKRNDLIQIDSKYIFNNEGMLEDKIEITYLMSRKEVEKAIFNINEVVILIKSNPVLFKKIENILISENNVTTKNKLINNLFKENNNLESMVGSPIWKIYKELFLDLMFISDIEIYNAEFDYKKIGDYFVRFNSVYDFETINKIMIENDIFINEDLFVSKKNLVLNIDENSFNKINKLFPFLINTATRNKTHFSDDFNSEKNFSYNINSEEIKQKINEALSKDEISDFQIGVIDTHAFFDEQWSKIVDVNNFTLPSNLTANTFHGTMVSSLIAGNDLFNNKKYHDGLGIFKVKHFGILPKEELDISYFIKKLEEIIDNNRDIKLWNLSIYDRNTPNNRDIRISELGKQLDRLQKDYEILFVIASGNGKVVSYGSDSILSLTVGSLFLNKDGQNEETSYCSNMDIFGLFKKPNAFDYGNDLVNNSQTEDLVWCLDESGNLEVNEEGTSISAPLMIRKCAHFIKKYGFKINSLKALINLETEILIKNKEKSVVNTNLTKEEGKITLFYDGEIIPGNQMSLKLNLPFRSKSGSQKKYRNFLATSSISYLTKTNIFVGDEYSSTEISVDLIAEINTTKKGELTKANKKIIQIDRKNKENNTDTTVIEQTNKNLVEDHKKFNPNKVIIDSKIKTDIDSKFIETYNVDGNDVNLIVTCIDIFGDKRPVKFGFVIKLYEIEENSLANFYNENIQVLNKVEITEKLIIKQKN